MTRRLLVAVIAASLVGGALSWWLASAAGARLERTAYVREQLLDPASQLTHLCCEIEFRSG
jgi:membrane protein YqaA with SNARE-associated domain